MTWDTGLQSQYLHFYSRKDAYVSELKVQFSTWQMSYSDVCPGFNFMNLFWLLYICSWKDTLAYLTLKKNAWWLFKEHSTGQKGSEY